MRATARLNRCSPGQVIAHSPQWEVPRHGNGRTADIIETILYADSRSAEFVQAGVECLRGRDLEQTLRNVWAFVRFNLNYRPDRAGHERVKSPGALFASRTGDCKSYSIAIAAILRALGIPYRYRFASYAPGDFTHVYIIADTEGGPVVLDSVHTKFDDEVAYYRHRDIRPKQTAMNGIGRISVDPSRLLLGAAALALLLTILSE